MNLNMSLVFFAAVFCAALITATESALPDWLVTKINWPAKVFSDSGFLYLTNGLVTKKFSLAKGLFATVDFYSHEKNSSLLRAISPEAIIELDGIPYNVGGFLADTTRGYLNRTDLDLKTHPDENSFQLFGYDTKTPEAPFKYVPKRGAPEGIIWPPEGVHLQLHFAAPATAPRPHKSVIVTVHYEMYNGIPLISKWMTVENKATKGVMVRISAVEQLCTNWQWSEQGYNWLFVTTDQPYGNIVTWTTEANASRLEPGSFQPVVSATFDRNFSILLNNNESSMTSFRVLELVIGSNEAERVGLAKRKMTRMLAPQVQENPIYFHMTDSSSPAFRKTVDQLVEVGFEMIMYSFWSGFDMESTNKTYIEGLKADIAYANSKGIEVGGYDLISLTRVVDNKWMALKEDGSVSDSACFASGWYEEILDKVLGILAYANLTVIETDGPYGGYTCSSTNHAHHEGPSDSVYRQAMLQGKFYNILQEKGMYINQPDHYFFQGGSKADMGYDESQFSMPRWLDLSYSRQGMFDDTYHYIPSQGWMFLPLVVYQGGGDAAKFEPLSQNIKEYEWGLAQYLGAGVAACYRGTRIYDTPETRDMVKKWVSFYKKYRQILTGDVIHVRRADMQSIDAFMHINNVIGNEDDPIKGLAFFFNPTSQELEQLIQMPLYYTGLTEKAIVAFEDNPNTAQVLSLSRDYHIEVTVNLKAQAITWMTIRED